MFRNIQWVLNHNGNFFQTKECGLPSNQKFNYKCQEIEEVLQSEIEEIFFSLSPRIFFNLRNVSSLLWFVEAFIKWDRYLGVEWISGREFLRRSLYVQVMAISVTNCVDLCYCGWYAKIKTAGSLFTETVTDISCGTLFPVLFKWRYSEPGNSCTVEEEGWKNWFRKS